jgi:CHASE2 domain-containing sensor protein
MNNLIENNSVILNQFLQYHQIIAEMQLAVCLICLTILTAAVYLLTRRARPMDRDFCYIIGTIIGLVICACLAEVVNELVEIVFAPNVYLLDLLNGNKVWIQFNGGFYCYDNNLTTLQGAPRVCK